MPPHSSAHGRTRKKFRRRLRSSRVYCPEAVERARPLQSVAWVDEQDLVARCLEGHRAAQRQLFDREKRRVQATLYRLLGSNQPLDDLVQEVFLCVFSFLPKFRGDSSLSAWIDRFTVRAALDYLRSGRRRQPHLTLVVGSTRGSMLDGDPAAEHRVRAREVTRRFYAALQGMPARHRVAFALHAIDHRSLDEVAALMGATVLATRVRVWCARRLLAKRGRHDPILAEYLDRGAR
jgi:RNA polymerase sigma-70 factor (ECF subfamily)